LDLAPSHEDSESFMSSSIAQNIEALCQEQGIERDLVIEAMKEAVRAAAKSSLSRVKTYRSTGIPKPALNCRHRKSSLMKSKTLQQNSQLTRRAN
jgi:hypothetical protein